MEKIGAITSRFPLLSPPALSLSAGMGNKEQPKLEKTRDKLPRLKKLIKGKKKAVFVLQDGPDPDALAAAAALRLVLRSFSDIHCVITYAGPISRPENRTLAEALELPFCNIKDLDFSSFDLIAVLDTQPGTGNNSLPPERAPHIVIDHHSLHREAGLAPFSDIRSNYGATSTILYEYLAELHITPNPIIAAALIYGIRTDTQILARDTTPADVSAYLALYPQASTRLLNRIEYSPVARSHFGLLVRAIGDATIHGRAVVSVIQRLPDDSIVAQVADLLVRLQDTDYAVCIAATRSEVVFSVRTVNGDATDFAKVLAGSEGTSGGHGSIAGGQIPLAAPGHAKQVMQNVLKRLRKAVGHKTRPKRLVNQKDVCT
jgi:nanoRNase/pAp phosphatase (c-di-AMP/oligoRNAs hydrolase)